MTKLEDWGFKFLIIGFVFIVIGAIMYEMITSGITFQYIIKSIQEDWNLGIGFVLGGFLLTITGFILLITHLHKETEKE